MLWPTIPIPAVPLDQRYAPCADGCHVTPLGSMRHHAFNANLAGLPALTVACGIKSDGEPFGLQLTRRTFAEAMVYGFVRTYEREQAWHQRKATVTEMA
ncbi:MAG: amidase family protein [Chloroflexota bacterium]|nr:amidase family protein [Chloroflexota bacterium]